MLGNSLLGLAFGAAYLVEKIFDGKDSSGDYQIEPRKFSIDDATLFLFVLANIVFRVDGTLHEEENKYLEKILDEYDEDSKLKAINLVDESMKKKEVFSFLKGRFKALKDYDRKSIVDEIRELPKVDGAISVEEEAFLIQFSQIAEEYEMLDIYIGTMESKVNQHLDHDFFEYLTKESFESKYPSTKVKFKSGNMYTKHPFFEDSLIEFSVDSFENSQREFFDGIIIILKDLGAKNVYISESKKQLNDIKSKYKGEANIDMHVGKKQIKGSALNDDQFQEISKSEEVVKVIFDGVGVFSLDKIFPKWVRNKLVKKYGKKQEYLTLINGRFGDNKIKHFEYQIKSVESKNLAKGISAAASFDSKLVKIQAAGNYDSNVVDVKAIEKHFLVEFH